MPYRSSSKNRIWGDLLIADVQLQRSRVINSWEFMRTRESHWRSERTTEKQEKKLWKPERATKNHLEPGKRLRITVREPQRISENHWEPVGTREIRWESLRTRELGRTCKNQEEPGRSTLRSWTNSSRLSITKMTFAPAFHILPLTELYFVLQAEFNCFVCI